MKRKSHSEDRPAASPPLSEARDAHHGDQAREKTELATVLHELRVHQVELEMQNEELRSAQRQLEASRNRYAELYDSAPAGFLTLDGQGVIQEINRTAAHWLNQEPGQLQGKAFQHFLLPESRPVFLGHLRAGEAQPALFESILLAHGGATLPVQVTTVPARVSEQEQPLIRIALTDNSQRLRTEQMRREGEEKYRRLYESMTDAFVNVDMQGRIRECNSAYVALLGYSKQELLDLTYVDLTPEEWRAQEARIVAEQIIPHGFSNVYEKEYRCKDGSILPVELRTFLIRDTAGVPAGMWAIVRDITARKQAEAAIAKLNRELEHRVEERTAALVEAEARYRHLAENTKDIIYSADAAGVVTYVGPQTRHYGWAPEEIVGRQLLEFVVPEDHAIINAELEHSAKTGEVRGIEFRVHAPDGRLVWFEENGTPQLDAAGRFAGFIGVLRDITERKEAETRERAMLVRLQSFERSVNQAPAVLFRWRIAPGWPVETVTENVRQFGYEPEDFLSGRVSWPGITHPDDVPRLEKEVAGLLEKGLREFGQNYRLLTKSGDVRWIEDRNRVITDEMGEPTHVQGVILDVTERRRTEAALEESEARFEQMAAYIDDVLYGVNGESGEFEYVSAAFTRMFGYTQEDLVRMGGREKFLATVVQDGRYEEQQRLFSHLKRHKTASSTPWQAWWRCKDGSLKFIEDHWIPVFVGDHLKATYGMLRDITERNRAEETLRLSEEQFRAMFETAAIGMAQADPQTGQFLRVNQKLCDITGYPMEELLERRFSDITHSEHRPGDWEQFQRVIRGEQPDYRVEKRYVRKDGTVAWVNVNMTVIRDAAGKPLRSMATIEDITGRKVAEAAVAAANQRYRYLFENMRDAYAHCRMIVEQGVPVDFEFLAVNPAFGRLTGLQAVEGRRVSELIPGYCRDNPDSLETFGRVARTGEPMQWEHYLAALDRWFSFSLYSPAPGEFVGVFDNITERKLAEERILQLNRIQSLLSGVNHAIAHITQRQELLDEICRVAVERGAFRLAWAGMVAPDGAVVPVASAGQVEYLNGIRIVVDGTDPCGQGPVGTCIRESRFVVIEDVEKDPTMSPWLERTRQFGLPYVAAFPIRVEGHTVGALATYAPKAGFFDDTELLLLMQVSDDISFALTSIKRDEERRQAEEQLRVGHAALSAAASGIVITDRTGTIQWVNAAFTGMTGYTLEETRGRNPRMFKSGLQDVPFYRELWSTILSGRVWHGELVNRHKSGRLYNEEITITPVRQASGEITHFIAVRQDITQRKRLELEMATAIERAQERIGQDLHDGLCQILTGAKFRASLLGQKLRDLPLIERGDADIIEALLDQAIEQARGIAYGLNPVRASAEGLMEALEQLAVSTSTAAGPQCTCYIPRPVRFEDGAIAIHLYRIAQEAVQNALKHSGAKHISIELTRRAASATLAVVDDGSGMPEQKSPPAGTGLLNMRRRAELIGGTLAITSTVGRGTTISCRVRQSPKAARA